MGRNLPLHPARGAARFRRRRTWPPRAARHALAATTGTTQVVHHIVGLERMVGVAVLGLEPEAEVGRGGTGRNGGRRHQPSRHEAAGLAARGRPQRGTARHRQRTASGRPTLAAWRSDLGLRARPRRPASALGSFGRPRTISPMMLRWIWTGAGVDRAGPGVEERRRPTTPCEFGAPASSVWNADDGGRPVGTSAVGAEDVDGQLGDHAGGTRSSTAWRWRRRGPGGGRRGTG